MMRYDAKHKDRTRQQLVAHAADAIRLHGPDRVGVAELMSRVGLTHGGFYAHFDSKDALIAAAIEEMFDQSAKTFARQTNDRAPAAALANYIDSYLSNYHVDHADKGCPLPAIAGDVSRLGPDARKRFAKGAEYMRARIALLIEALGRPPVEARALATSIVSEMSGAIALARVAGSATTAKAIWEHSREGIKRRLGLV